MDDVRQTKINSEVPSDNVGIKKLTMTDHQPTRITSYLKIIFRS